MKYILIAIISFMSLGCNLVKWNQDRLGKKYERKGMQEKFLKTDDHTIHYWEGGEGDTVMLIHGFGADGQMTWNRSILDLVKDYHVIVPDLLWFGGSYSKSEPNLRTQIEAMFALLDDRQAKKINLVGISYGGFVSLGMVYKRPDLVKKLCIVDSPGMTYNVDLLDTLCMKQNVSEVQDIFVVRQPDGVKKLVEVSSYKPRKIPKGILNGTYEIYFSKNHDQQYRLLETLPGEKDIFKALEPEQFPPALVIWGEHDQVFPLAEGEKLAQFLNAEIKVIPKAGHASNLDKFSHFQRYLRRFLEN